MDFQMVWGNDPNFPWTKFWRVWENRELYYMQIDDGSEGYNEVEDKFAFEQAMGASIYLVLQGAVARGFWIVTVRGGKWVDLHVAFLTATPLRVKIESNRVLVALLRHAGVRKATAHIPDYHAPAKCFARMCGFKAEARLPGCLFVKREKADVIVYGKEL